MHGGACFTPHTSIVCERRSSVLKSRLGRGESAMDRAITIGVAGIGVLIAAVTLAVAPSPQAWGAWWVLLLLTVGIVLVLIAIYIGNRDVRARPRLVFGDAKAEIRGTTRKPTGGYEPALMMTTTTTTALYITNLIPSAFPLSGFGPATYIGPGDQAVYGTYVLIANKPRIAGRDAKDVVTRLRFEGSDGSITEIHGRWSQLPQHGDPERTLEAEGIDIPSNGEWKWLDVAIKYQDDEVCYAFNDENRFRSRDLRYRALGPSPIRVEVTAKGSNCQPATASFVLTHRGKGRGLSVAAS